MIPNTSVRVLLALAVAALSAAFWYATHLQAQIFADVKDESMAAGLLYEAVLQADAGAQDIIYAERSTITADLLVIQQRLTKLEDGLETTLEMRSFSSIEATVDRFLGVVERTVAAVQAEDRAALPALVRSREAAVEAFGRSYDELFFTADADRSQRQGRVRVLLFSVIGALALGAVLVLVATERRIRAERQRRSAETQLTEILQVARSEEEAYQVLARHAERVAGSGSHAVVLNRNNSENRLEARTPLAEESLLAEALEGATPDSCLAIRLASPHQRAWGDDTLMPCGVCGKLTGRSTCVPALVGGQVTGAVLLEHGKELRQGEREQLESAVASAAPVIANLRSLAVAEARAATDGLTGIANNRAIQDALKRMVAHAHRAGTPLGAILFDLDLFKQINDSYGHERGDEALAAIGAASIACIRSSDFVGRWGGEEFVVLLPDTDRTGALNVAQKIREALSQIQLEGIDRRLTASFGVAAIPQDAEDGATLLRCADRALYRAKSNGRDRVETLAEPGGDPEPGLALVAGR